MPKKPVTDQNRRDQQTNFNLTLDEKAELHAFADEMGMTISQACRYLIKKGLSVHKSSNDLGE